MLFFQLTDIDIDVECSFNPCKNGGAVNKYTCSCAAGFNGDNCESKFSVILYNVKDIKVRGLAEQLHFN